MNKMNAMTKEECDKEYQEGKLIMSDDKCKECEHYYSCVYMLLALNGVGISDE